MIAVRIHNLHDIEVYSYNQHKNKQNYPKIITQKIKMGK